MPTTILNPGDPRLNGASGPDSFIAPSGNSGINGFGGIDTVTFSFNLVDATVSYHDNVVWIDTATSHTELTGIQTYIFNDGTVSEADGNPLVADLYYYSTYHDIWTAHADADLHYATSGWHEHRNPSAFFDTDLYLSINQDVLASGVNPLVHFDTVGWTQGRQPSANFDVQKYLVTYPDVAAANIDPLAHFLSSGVEEGRVPFPVATITNNFGFDALYYLQTYADVKAAHVDPYQHFLTSGWKEGRNPNAYFDTLGYLATYTDVAAAGVNPLIHFDSGGWHEGRIPSPGFDTAAYLAAYPDVAAAGVDPLAHFLKYGINEGRVAFARPIFDTNGAANIVLEGAAAGTNSGLSVSWGAWISPALSFSLGSDSSGGGFAINNLTGAVTVADSTKLDFETSGASHSYVITVVAHDGGLSSSQTFTINIGDVTPTTPIDGNAAANTVVEGAANGSTVGVTLFSDEPNGPPVVYQLTDNAGGRFAVDSSTGVVTVANSALLDFESGAHSFVITGRTQVGAVFTATQNFTINLTNAAPSPISDSNAASETVNEGAAVNTLVGIDADSTDPLGPAVIWSITSDSSGGGFKIDANGVVSVADASKIDYEGAPDAGHSYSIIVQASDGVGGTTSRNFSIVVNNVNPTTPVDTDGAANTVTEGAAAGTLVGVQASASDVNGPPVTWSITSDTSNLGSGGAFTINSSGVVSVGDATKLNYETAPGVGRSYDVTVQASDGEGGTSSQVFNILVANVAPATPTEVADGTAGGSVLEGAAADTLVGITVSASDVNGPAVAWSILSDTSGSGFRIDANGVISVLDPTALNYETAPGVGKSYDITVQASDGFNSSTQTFNIQVGNVNPTTPTDGVGPTGGTVAEGAATGTLVGIDADSLDPNGPPVTWSILSGSASGGFQIDSGTGIVSVLNGALLNYENAPSLGVGQVGHTILVQASDGQGGTSTQTFTIELTNEAPAAPADTDPVGNGAGTIRGIATFDATAGTQVGIHAQSAGDPAGGTVTYELAAGSSTFFQINASTGEVSVSADGVGDLVEGTDYDIFVVAKDSTGLASGTSSPPAQFTIRVPAPGVAAPIDNDGAADEISEAATGVPGNIGLSAYTGVQANSATATSYSISTDTSGGGFQIDPTDGKIYVADGTLIDFESAPGLNNSYSVTVVASDSVTGTTASSVFVINVLDVAPPQPEDGDPSAGLLIDPVEGRVATGLGSAGANVGITVSSSDIDGGTLTYSLTDNAGVAADDGGTFQINANTGVITVLNAAGLTLGLHTVQARAFSVDGNSGTQFSLAETFTIEVVSNQPVVDLNDNDPGNGTSFSNTFAEDGADAAITDTDAAIVYAGFTNLTSATITLTNAQVGDALAVVTPGTLTVNTVSGGGKITVTLTGNAAFSVYETALRSITFENSSNTPVTGARTITVVVSDGVNPPSNAATSTITVSATNDAPTLNLTLPNLVTTTPYQENGAPLALASAGSVTDPDAPVNFNGGRYTVEITNDSAGDQIVLLASSGFSAAGSSIIYGGVEIGTILAGTSLGTEKVTIVLDADATPVVVNALSNAFAYRSISDNPLAGVGNDRTVDFTFQDGGNTGAAAPGASSNTVTQTVRVTAVNDAPAIGNLNGNAASFTEGAATPAVLLDTGTAATVTDVDSANFDTGTLTVSITSGGTTAEDVLGISATGGITTSGTAAGSTVSFGATVIGTIALNGTGIGENLVITFDPDATPAAVEALVRALTYDNTNGTTASTATRAISVTLTDGDGGSTSVNTTVAVTEASNLTGQLWYVTRDGTTAGDNVVGHINSDGGGIVHFSLATDTMNDVGLDTSADLYFLLDSNSVLSSYRLNNLTVLSDETVGSGLDNVDAIVVDPLHNTIFVTVTGATTGIQKYTYDPATGVLTAGNFLLTDASLTTGAYVQAIDLSIDLLSERLYYVDSDAVASNEIYVVDYTDGSNVATNLITAELLVQFEADGSEGFIQSVAVDNRDSAATTDDIVYFLTNDILMPGTASLWFLDRSGGNTTPALLTGAPTLAGVSSHTGLVFDPVANQLYISNQDATTDTDSIIQVQLDAAGTAATGSIPFNLATLTGQATPDGTTIPGQTAFDTLPVATVHDTAFSEGTPILVDPALTISDPDAFLTGVTITITGGFAGNGDTLSFDTTGTAITGPASPVAADGSGNITLTLTGRDTLANYQGVLVNTLTFNSGDNPTNFGANPTRTVTWYFDDGAAGDPHSTGNTKTSTITITDVNDAPTLDLDTVNVGSLDFTTSYQIGDPAVAVTGTVDVVDVDNATIASATVTLTNAQVGDALAINGALPAGIAAAIVAVDNADPTPDTITVTLTGPATQAAFEAALHQVVFTSSSSVIATPRVIDIAVDDGTPQSSNVAQTTISLTGNTPPVAWDDAASATEAGGATAAVDPSGNVFADNNALVDADGDTILTNDVDFDAEDAPLPTGAVGGSVVVVTQVTHGLTTVSAGTTIIGTYGAVTINANGSYSYSIDQSNASVQALVSGGSVLNDVFTYTIRDAFGATGTAQLDITINGADDFAQAFADTGSMGEDAVGAVSFNVRANDTLDPDTTAHNTIAITGTVTASGPAGTGIVNGSVSAITADPNAFGDTTIQITLGAAFQTLAAGETATVTVPYTLTGDAGQDSGPVNLVVTVNGANDLPVANDDNGGSISEDASTTAFTVITNDTLDVDHPAPDAGTAGLVTTGTVTVTQDAVAIAKGIDGADVTVGVNASNQITVSLGADFHKLSAGETATVTVAYLLHGDGADTDGANLTVTVTGANDAPVVDLLSTPGLQTTGITATFTENGPVPPSVPVNVLPQVLLSDVDGGTLTGATVTLTNAQVGVDILTLQGEGASTSGTLASSGIGYAITSNNTVVTFSNVDSLSDYQDALRLIQFNNASDNPAQTDRTFTVTINDGAATNAATTATLDFVAINDVPVNTTPNNLNPMSDTDFAFTAGNTLSVTDPDAGGADIHVTLSTAHGNLSVSLAGGANVFTGAQNSHTLGLNGTVTEINAALATLTYHSDAGYTGLDSISVVTNDQGNSPAPAQSDTDSITLGVIPKVWIIDNSVAGSGGDGSAGNPFRSIAEFNAATTGASTNEYVLLKTGTGTYAVTDGIHLKDGMELVGGGDGLSFVNPIIGQPAIVFNPAGGARPTIQVSTGAGDDTGIDLALNNKVHGLNVQTMDGTAIGIDDGVANNSVGNLQVSNMQITGAGKAIDIDNGGALTVTLDKLTSTGSGSQGIDLGGNVTGNVTINDNTSTISGGTTAATAFNISTNGLLNVTYNGGITQAQNAALVSISGGHTGTVTFQNGTLTGADGTGLQFDNADGTYNFNGTNTLTNGDGGASANAGIDILNGSSGTFNFQAVGGAANTTITNANGTAFNLLNSNANVIYSGSITESGAGSAVSIDNHDSGTITFQNGSITSNGGGGSGITVQNNSAGTVNFNSATISLTTGASNGVTLAANTGSAINFTMANGGNGLDISTTTGAGFSATGGGTVVVTDPDGAPGGIGNTIASVGGTALNVTSTTIGASGLTFQSIAANGGTNGIVLNTTGSVGLTVTGDSGSTNNGSGGTIQNMTGAGISLTSTQNVSFDQVNISTTGGSGVNGTGVTNFTYTNGTITNAGDASVGAGQSAHDSAINFNGTNTGVGNNIAGTLTVTGNTITNAFYAGVNVESDAGTVTSANISNNVITNPGFSGVNFSTTGTATTAFSLNDADIANNNISASGGNGIQISMGNGNAGASGAAAVAHAGFVTIDGSGRPISDPSHIISITGNLITLDNGPGSNATQAITVASTSASNSARTQINFEVLNNGTVANPLGSSAIGTVILIGNNGFSDMAGVVDNNRIDASHTADFGNGNGIAGGNGVGGAGAAWTPRLNLTVSNNNVKDTDGSGILLVNRQTNGEAFFKINNNTVTVPLSGPGPSAEYGIRVDAGNTPDVGQDAEVYLNIFSNVSGGVGGGTGIGIRKQGAVSTTNDFGIFDAAGGPALAAVPTNTDVVNFINALNPGSVGGTLIISGSNYQRDTTLAPPLLAAAGGVAAAPGQDMTGVDYNLTQAELDAIGTAAIARWEAAGLSAAQVAALKEVTLSVGDLPNAVLGQSNAPGHLTFDVDGAGHGWFVDQTPFDDAEFAHILSATRLQTDPTEAPAGHMDLLTTVMHELGHQIGLDDTDGPSVQDDLMYILLVDGERRLPDAQDVADAAAANAGLLGAPPQQEIMARGVISDGLWQV